MAGLTTHVLDTTRGGPAAGVLIELHILESDGGRRLIASVRTNADGRTDAPLIGAAEARAGTFELAFHLGAYFRASGTINAAAPFLDIVPIRFTIADPKAHYHVPLIATPWSYSTYRGS
ncbi:MAG: hydroxyisourate hydrolase [Bradyrhizobium sp.]|nr:MAG: hydroxyisourate hydrolase [Bradyrhizobium sp.]